MTFSDWFRSRAAEAQRESLPIAVRAGIQELWQGILRRAIGRHFSGESIWSRSDDWEILCILDGCRVDLMMEVCEDGIFEWLPDPNEVKVMNSVGTTSAEWINNTFGGKYSGQASQIAYVTGNGFVSEARTQDESWPHLPLGDSDFGFLHEVWKTMPSAPIDGVSSPDPDVMTDFALRTWSARDDLGVDRLVVHYMQPHAPFRSNPEWNRGATNAWERHRDKKISQEELWESYRDNLIWVLESIDYLRSKVAADVVLSADHGNGMGEWGVWAHPPETPAPAVRRVPWVKIDTVGEPAPVTEKPLKPDEQADRDIGDFLSNLGYK